MKQIPNSHEREIALKSVCSVCVRMCACMSEGVVCVWVSGWGGGLGGEGVPISFQAIYLAVPVEAILKRMNK